VLVVGVSGKEAEEVGGESFRIALETGRKIPAPAIVVVKYETLCERGQVSDMHSARPQKRGPRRFENVQLSVQEVANQDLPIHITTILTPYSKVRMQLNSGKGAFLPLYGSDEAHSSVHISGHIDGIPDGDVVGGRHSGCSRRHLAVVVTQHTVDPVRLADIGNGG
jgi:hypothetical protein